MNKKFFRYGKPKVSCVCDEIWLKRRGYLRPKFCDDGVTRYANVAKGLDNSISCDTKSIPQAIGDMEFQRQKTEWMLKQCKQDYSREAFDEAVKRQSGSESHWVFYALCVIIACEIVYFLCVNRGDLWVNFTNGFTGMRDLNRNSQLTSK